MENAPQKKLNKENIILIVIQAVIIAICLFGAIFIMINHRDETNDPTKFNTSMMLVVTDSMEPTIETNNLIFSKKFKDKDIILDLGTVVTYAVKSGSNYKTITHRIVGYYFYQIQGENKIATKIYGKQNLMSFEDLKKTYATNIEFAGYLTRGDKYTLEHNSSLDDLTIKNEDGTINYNLDDGYYTFLTNDQVLSVWKGSQSKFLGRIVYFLSNPNHIMLTIVLPIILLIVYNMVVVLREIVSDKHLQAKEDALKKLEIDEEEIKRKAIEEYLASQKEDEK